MVFNSKRNFSQNKRDYNSLTKLGIQSKYTDEKERTTSKYNGKTKN